MTMEIDLVCETCGIGFRLPSGRCDHCDTIFDKRISCTKEKYMGKFLKWVGRFFRFGHDTPNIVCVRFSSDDYTEDLAFPTEFAKMMGEAYEERDLQKRMVDVYLSIGNMVCDGDFEGIDLCLSKLDLEKNSPQLLLSFVIATHRVADKLKERDRVYNHLADSLNLLDGIDKEWFGRLRLKE